MTVGFLATFFAAGFGAGVASPLGDAGFAAGDLVGLQQMGFGLGIAILLDATIVRMILVPASMRLLGRWNWYLPSWLEWMPDFRVEPPETTAVPAAAND